MAHRSAVDRTRRRILALAAGSGLFSAACGYSLGAATGLQTIQAGRAVSVRVVDNLSLEPEAGPLALRALARALPARRGRTVSDGTLRLDAEVPSVRAVPVGFVGPQDVRLWRVEVLLRVRLSESGAVFARGEALEREEYRAGADLEATEVARLLALDRAMTRAASAALDGLSPEPRGAPTPPAASPAPAPER